jgi:hypothetical protein
VKRAGGRTDRRTRSGRRRREEIHRCRRFEKEGGGSGAGLWNGIPWLVSYILSPRQTALYSRWVHFQNKKKGCLQDLLAFACRQYPIRRQSRKTDMEARVPVVVAAAAGQGAAQGQSGAVAHGLGNW